MRKQTTRGSSLACITLALAAGGAWAQATANKPCTLVVGAGRDHSVHDSALNNRWNQLNFTFFDAAIEPMRAAGPVEMAFFPVEAGDAARHTDKLLAQAQKNGCNRLVLFSVYSDASKPEPDLVFAMRVSPIHRVADAKKRVSYSLGAAEYEREYRYATTPEVLDKVAPGRIADQALRDYAAARKR